MGNGYTYPDFGQHAAVIHALRNGGAHVEVDTNALLIEAGLIDGNQQSGPTQEQYRLHQQRFQESVARLVNEAQTTGSGTGRPLNCIIWTCFMTLALFVVPAQMFYGNHTEFFFFFVIPLGESKPISCGLISGRPH
jgi:hypothetical protein